MAKTYVTGKPCPKGHIGPRYSSNANCVACVKGNAKARAEADPEKHKRLHAEWRKRNPAKIRAWSEASRKKNPDKSRAYCRKWAKTHSGQMSAIQAAWRKANPDKIRELKSAWKAGNPGYFTVAAQRRRVRKSVAPGSGVSPTEWREVVAASLGLCAYCNQRSPLTMDHVDPLSRGGAHDPDNIVAACKSCNSSKHDTPLALWLALRALREAMHRAA